ncbi:hypothetical protein CPLU01_08873 [Colletotrichum plurivorum]|uniref:Uncharacterized protein n=1 Tax=Colletotrichum plurivorum TaxID=2175906 RepID=A0A8H6NC36_9PEZI|nr:hypothetical protein CPLU01_08873 [Colletotrichum plurivorum]
MALLGQHEQIPEPTTALSPYATPHSSEISHPLQVIISQCQTETEIQRELWDDFEIHRRSAAMHLRLYLDHLQKTHAERPRHVYEFEDSEDDETIPMGTTREQWRLKIARDTLSRDLLAMQETLEMLTTRAPFSPSGRVLHASTLSASAVVLLLWESSHGREALVIVAAYVAGFIGYNWSSVWKSFEAVAIGSCRRKIEELHRRLPLHRVDERDPESLQGSFGLANFFRK